MVNIMDEAIGNVTEAMKEAGLWNETLTIVTTDNGGRPNKGGYNWPLRGKKRDFCEGGVRGVGLVHGTMLQKTGVKCKELLHVTDWYPTLVNLAERSLGKRRTRATIPQLDGFNIWRSISEGAPSPRKEILHNIIDQKAAIRVGDMKLILNQTDRERYIPPELVRSIPAEQGKKGYCCKKVEVGLYNITADPYEIVDLSKQFPDIVEALMTRVEYYRQSVVPPENKPSESLAGITACMKGYWGPWKD